MHPGVTVDDMQARSAFEILIPGPVEITAPPTEAERMLLREIDPPGIVVGR